ncbi:hypothetical protein Nepgr_008033 [Nepenthes gracilis]|uniref:Uncharacterized protein n=1 Tax=Nepenthes gracilis TaxID=150966 RepID=A0AAD3XIV4_NEPGR|nr:hypothetical protein Nepgr_008033 [Nepenthes gracilis]
MLDNIPKKSTGRAHHGEGDYTPVGSLEQLKPSLQIGIVQLMAPRQSAQDPTASLHLSIKQHPNVVPRQQPRASNNSIAAQ